MTPQQRAIKKELLLMKGEALRLKLRMELKAIKRPMSLAGEGWRTWGNLRRLGPVLGALGGIIPSKRLRRMLLGGAQLFLLWRAARKLWARL
ncbi:hypothetical protein [Pseudogulbenkiania ferrooxidans]|uniref:YqjK-like protein n=1 Tax=Pseudogulbenkiania ferrooxidans 2002 TaxID=279714 RepID=B9Z1A9_9NEIS|nr:hypothetical protein [Pseudogulbenkiania ferrooxidans]EEG09204.1 conserved hypothetical protein [Pseudogulbenkiania ferrooxidans 2002]